MLAMEGEFYVFSFTQCVCIAYPKKLNSMMMTMNIFWKGVVIRKIQNKGLIIICFEIWEEVKNL